MKIIVSVSAPAGVRGGKTVESFGNVQILYRNSLEDNTFSVIFVNRMNNQSIAVHKFNNTKYSVEFGSPQGVDYVLTFNNVKVAAQLALLNTDITRIEDETALEARRAFLRAMARYESRAKYVEFTDNAWKINRFRNKPVIFDNPQGEQVKGILNVVLPPSGEFCIVTPDEDKKHRVKIESKNLWLQ